MAITETRQYREPFVEAAGLGVTNEGLRLLKQTLPTATYTGKQFVAGQSQLEQDAAKAAADLGQLTGTGAGTGAGSIASYMSPYQEQVIDASLAALDREQARGLGMLQGDVKPMPMMRFADGGFGGITEAVETIEEKPKEFLVDKLKVTQQPGQSEMRAIIEAMYNDIDGVMPDDRKNEFYELYAPQMYRNGEMDKSEFEFIQTEILDKEVPKMKEGGIMNLGGKEMDLRGGGFVPIGKKERADDVPARLSKNEFIMTADAVRAAGGGSVNKGAKRMYDLMNNLEARV